MLVLDTHALLWWTLAPEKLSQKAHSRCAEMEQSLGYVSSISIWEIGIKIKNGKLDIGTSLDDYVRRLSSLSCIEIIAVNTETWVENIGLPWNHRDPADRTIVSTAKILGLPLVTKDRVISDFYSDTIW